jgi:kynurenine formamidase
LSAAALEYLVLNRQVLAIGSDAPWVGAGGSGWQLLADPRSAETTQTAYYLENLTGLDLLPERGAMGVVGLPRARDHRRAVVRVTAIVPRER